MVFLLCSNYLFFRVCSIDLTKSEQVNLFEANDLVVDDLLDADLEEVDAVIDATQN